MTNKDLRDGLQLIVAFLLFLIQNGGQGFPVPLLIRNVTVVDVLDGSLRAGWRHWRLIVLALLALLCGCANGDGDAGAAYLKARSAQRTGDFSQSLAMAREGLRRWPEGDAGWKFRLVCAEDLIYLGHVQDAGTLL